jgi:hypothetical protein
MTTTETTALAAAGSKAKVITYGVPEDEASQVRQAATEIRESLTAGQKQLLRKARAH